MTTQSLAQQFATDYAKGVVPAALEAIKLVKRNTKRIAMMALAVSTPHQALYLFGLGHPHGAIDIATAAFFAVLIPAVVDLGMITMLTVTQTVGMQKRAKRRAMLVLAVLVAVSATVNAVAPGNIVLRLLTGFTAVILAAVEWVASSLAPDFSDLEAAETGAAPAALTPVVDEVEARKAERRERERFNRAVKAAAAKLEAERVARDAELVEMAAGFVPANAPVSPAPGEAAAYL